MGRSKYKTVRIDSKTQYEHRIVAERFLPDWQTDLQVNHINGDKYDNRPENPQMVTNQQNRDHAIRLGLVDNKGEKNGLAKLTDAQVFAIRYIYTNMKVNDLAELFEVGRKTISRIRNNKGWRHI